MDIVQLYWIILAVMGIGILGAAIPGLPGASIILTAMLVWGLATQFATVNLPVLIAILVLILSAAVEYLATYWGAKQVGASKWGQFGALAGMTLGFFGLIPIFFVGGPIFGVLLGAMIGAFIGEYLYRRDLDPEARTQQALKVSVGVIVGSLIGNIVETLLAIAAVLIFVFSTWSFVFGFR